MGAVDIRSERIKAGTRRPSTHLIPVNPSHTSYPKSGRLRTIMQIQSSFLSFLRKMGIVVIGIVGLFLSYHIARTPFLPTHTILKYIIIVLCVIPVSISVYRYKKIRIGCFVVIALYMAILKFFIPDFSGCVVSKSDHGEFYECFIGSEYIIFEVDQNGITMSPISTE